ncbi:Nucleotidyltransferase domain-containing protein [Gammaproteobacteria bacterium]
MRLYLDEKNTLTEIIKNLDAEVYLFGSRVDDTKKGGDIDILIFSNQNPLQLSQKISRDFYLALESKLDVVVIDKKNMSEDQALFVNSLILERLK